MGVRVGTEEAAGDGVRVKMAAVAVAAVLRRLYHPRPSIRRLASLVAVRLAFDSAAFFSPLLQGCHRFSPEEAGQGGAADVGVAYSARCCPCGGGGGGGGGGDGVGGVGFAVGVGGGGRGCGGEFLDGDGFVVPTMVVQAYPRLERWGDSDGGGGGGVVCSSSSSSRSICGSGSGQSTETPLFVKLAAGEWAVLTRNKEAKGLPRNKERDERGRGVSERGKAERGVVVARLERALSGAGRRSEFAAAMLGARAWMLAGHG